jgi:hypothetical protein
MIVVISSVFSTSTGSALEMLTFDGDDFIRSVPRVLDEELAVFKFRFTFDGPVATDVWFWRPPPDS